LWRGKRMTNDQSKNKLIWGISAFEVSLLLAVLLPIITVAYALFDLSAKRTNLIALTNRLVQDHGIKFYGVGTGDQGYWLYMRDSYTYYGNNPTEDKDVSNYEAELDITIDRFRSAFLDSGICGAGGCAPENYRIEFRFANVLVDTSYGRALRLVGLDTELEEGKNFSDIVKAKDGKPEKGKYYRAYGKYGYKGNTPPKAPNPLAALLINIYNANSSGLSPNPFQYAIPSTIVGVASAQDYGATTVNPASGPEETSGAYLRRTVVFGAMIELDISDTFTAKILGPILKMQSADPFLLRGLAISPVKEIL
jgi:hypothetical protein